MSVKRIVVFAALCLLVASVCHAQMTVWFQNGESVRAYKVVFQGPNADLYLLDGSVRRVSSDQIDLKSSGFGKPEGTYGGKGPGPGHLPVATPPMPVNQSARQAQLKDEWERSEKRATAQKDFGVIKTGDVVHIVGQTEEPPDSPYFQPVARDDAFVILYKKPDGMYDKKLLDAVTFANYFKIEEKQKPVVSLPIEPRNPEPSPLVESQEKKPSAPIAAKPAPPGKTPVTGARPAEQPAETRSAFPIVYVLAGLAVIGAAAGILLSRKRKKAFVDTSQFRQYEEELRDFEIEIWLKHGRTMEQLMDISIKKFYGDQPGPMAVLGKMLKGLDRAALVTFIAKQSGLDMAASERIYSEMKQRLEWIRSTIDAVSKRTGRAPGADTPMAPTGIMPIPKPAPAAAKPPANQAARPAPAVPSTPPMAPTGIMPIPKAPAAAPKAPAPPIAPARAARAASDIPAYLNNVLRNLAALSAPEE